MREGHVSARVGLEKTGLIINNGEHCTIRTSANNHMMKTNPRTKLTCLWYSCSPKYYLLHVPTAPRALLFGILGTLVLFTGVVSFPTQNA
jgi:hypothetical protein